LEPDPPRKVEWLRFAVRPYNREMAPRQVVIAVLFIAVFASTYVVEDNGIAIWIVRLIIGVGGLWILGVGLIAGLQIAWHTRYGLWATAGIVSWERSTDDPLQLAGERIVHHPQLGDFRDRYLFSAPWALALSPGDVLEVLVDPARPRTWYTIARHEEGR
jgi:hypothetical protein